MTHHDGDHAADSWVMVMFGVMLLAAAGLLLGVALFVGVRLACWLSRRRQVRRDRTRPTLAIPDGQ